jgi:glyoxylase-like metal-dependent hydrolase (beta-lactamase superfamily II)
MSAQLDVIVEGYADDRVAGTVTLIRDGEAVIVVDPGMVADRSLILDPLAALGVQPGDVTDVVFSHHHLDHTLHAALFPAARFHDFQAIYRGDIWEDREAEGFSVAPNTTLLETRGHTDQDISTVVQTAGGVVVLTHLWWSADGPLDDPYAPDPGVLRESRLRVLGLRPVQIIPGHGPAFEPSDTTPI